MNRFTRNVKQAFGIVATITALGTGLSERAEAQVLINENFSSGSSLTPPSGWGNIDNGATANQIWDFSNPGGRSFSGGTPGFSAPFAILDSDNYGNGNSQNADLVTPSFDASVAATYLLEFDNNWEECCGAIGRVEVWNGTTWTTVLTLPNNGDADGDEDPSTHETINITAAVGSSATAQVRFHYEAAWDYWWAIDNVKVSRFSCTPPAATFSTLPNCGSNQFSVSVNLTSLGSATSINIREGATVYATATATGSFTVGPFASGTNHIITLEHNGDSGCNVSSTNLTYVCPATNDECASALSLTPSATCTPLTATTSSATTSATVPGCYYEQHGDVWFSFVANGPAYSIKVDNVTSSAATFYAYGVAAYSGSCGSLTELNCGTGTEGFGSEPAEISLTGLTAGQTVYVQVWEDEAYDGSFDPILHDMNFNICVTEPPPAPTNDEASGAISLVVGAPCTGAAYSNVSASSNSVAGEPYSNCHSNSTGDHSVWFSFVAPASGSVKITTDNGTTGSLSDTKIGLFSATDASDYSTFTILACDEDNGVDNETTDLLSTIFATGLTGGTTYYVQVDAYDPDESGTFCIQVEEINPTMLSNSASCADIAAPYGTDPGYTGWVTLLDADGKLVALVRNTAGGQAGSYYGSYNIDGNGFGTPRQDANGVYYLSRNYNINNDDVTSGVAVQFFFHPGEIATLSGVTGNATTLSNLNVTRQAGTTCFANFVEGNGATSVLLQTANGQVNGVSWIQVETPGFSNFYLMGGTVPLFIDLKDISANNVGNRHKVEWTTAREERGEYFELERSADSKNFSLLARIDSKGDAGTHTYWDQSPLNGTSYYRLKLVHSDGKTSYSKVVSAALTGTGIFEVKALPNPVSHILKVLISGGSTEAVVTLSDVTGKTLRTYSVAGGEVAIDMSAMAQGIYMVKYQDESHTQTIKVSKR
jgi:hypothetical protein